MMVISRKPIVPALAFAGITTGSLPYLIAGLLT